MSNKQRDKHPPTPKADWIAWGLHLIFGVIVGFAVGWWLASRLSRAGLFADGGLVSAVVGISFIVAAFASHHGDRLWMKASVYSVVEPPRSKASLCVSWIIGIIGAIMVAASLQAPENSSSSVLRWLPFPFLVIIGWLIVHAIREGTVLFIHGFVHQHEHPFVFWLLVAAYGVSFLGLLAMVIG